MAGLIGKKRHLKAPSILEVRRRLLHGLVLLALVSCLVAATTGQAQTEETAAATFFIETITVEGARFASSRLVLSESLLQPGRAYSEDELRLGVYRLKRLPFILEARFSLRKGSVRGTYELVITVEEPRRFFLGLDATAVPEEDWSGVGRGAVGLRTFAGANGVAFVALEGDELRAGYTHYNLFGKNLFASLEVGGKSSCCRGIAFEFGDETSLDRGGLGSGVDPFELTLKGDTTGKLAFTLGLPLGKSQGLRFVLRNEESERNRFFSVLEALGSSAAVEVLAEETQRQEAELRWLSDTTDDPVVPTRGRLITVALAGVDNQRDTAVVSPGAGGRISVEEGSRSFEARSAMRLYWPLPKGQALSFGWEATLSRERNTSSAPGGIARQDNSTDSDAEIWVGYSRDLWGRDLTRRFGSLRLEVRVLPGVAASTVNDDGESSFEVELTHEIEASVVFRSGWGLFRLRLLYDSEGE